MIGSQVVAGLAELGHEVLAADLATGVDTVTGEGLAEAVAGADVVVDVTNSRSFVDDEVMSFFTTSTANILAAEEAAGVRHHVLLSIVGAEHVPHGGYMRAKVAQERLVEASGIPYCIVHATQFFEFVRPLVEMAGDGDTVRLAEVWLQPAAAAEAAQFVVAMAAGEPMNRALEFAGPERHRLGDLARDLLRASGDDRSVVADPEQSFYGAHIGEDDLLPGPDATLGTTTFEQWLADQAVNTSR